MNNFGNPMDWYWPASAYFVDPNLLQASYYLQSWSVAQEARLRSLVDPSEIPMIKKEEPEAYSPLHETTVKVEVDPNPLMVDFEADLTMKQKDGGRRIRHLEEQNKAFKQLEAANLEVQVKEEENDFFSEEKTEKYEVQKHSSSPQEMEEEWIPFFEEKEPKPCRFRRDRHDRRGPNEVTLAKFRSILSGPLEDAQPPTIIKDYEEQLELELKNDAKQSGEDIKTYILREMDLARKNITQKYLRLYRLILRLMGTNASEQKGFEKLKGLLSRSVSSIPTILKIYREPTFEFFVEFLRKEVVTDERFPQFVIALPMRPAEKLVMLGGTSGMVFAINNPQVSIGSWYFDPRELVGDTSHIIKAVKERQISIDQVVKMLTRVYEKVLKVEKQPKFFCRYSNIASRFATIIQQAIGEAKKLGLLKKHELTELKEISRRTAKSSSISSIKEMLAFDPLRLHLKTQFIENNRLIVQVLGDPSLNCRTKLGVLESYQCFAKAVSDPNTLKKWH